jgi:hypothetical protein
MHLRNATVPARSLPLMKRTRRWSFNPVSVLGLDGAATAGDKFNVFEDEKEAKQIASAFSINA